MTHTRLLSGADTAGAKSPGFPEPGWPCVFVLHLPSRDAESLGHHVHVLATHGPSSGDLEEAPYPCALHIL